MDETATKSQKMDNAISTAASGIASLVDMVTSSYSKRKQAEHEFYKNSIALAHEYALALNEQLRLQSELSESGFITDYAGRINDGFNALTDATDKYQEALGKLGQGKVKIDLKNAIDWKNVGKGALTGAATGAAIGSVIPVIGTAVGAVVGGLVGGLVGLFGGKKKKEEYGGLLEVFPQLIDGAGNFNKELAKTIINTDQADDNTKQLLQNALDWADAVEAANEQIKSIVVELSGDLGNNLRDAIVSAWESGEDASKRMFDAASKSMENFIENLLYSTVFSDIFDEFGQRLADSLNPMKGDGDILDDFDWLMEQMDERDDAYVAMLDAFKKRASEQGYDMWQPEAFSQSGKAGAFTTMTQDQASKREGLLTSLQNHAASIDDLVANMSDAMYEALDTLIRIADNTEYCRYLEDIKDDIARIIRDGLKVK